MATVENGREELEVAGTNSSRFALKEGREMNKAERGIWSRIFLFAKIQDYDMCALWER